MNKMLTKKLKFIRWFHSLFPGKYCWTDCVAWAYSKTRWNPFKIDGSKGCEVESIEHQVKACYCGSWKDGKCWEKLPQIERDVIITERECETIEHLPF